MIVTRKRKSKVEYIADEMRQRITRGEISPDIPLASSRELAAEFGVAPLTADRAIRQLVAEGLLNRFKGSGTYIKANSPAIDKRWRIGYCEDLGTDLQYPLQKVINDAYIAPGVSELRKKNCNVSMINYYRLQSAGYCQKIFPELDALIVSKSFVDQKTLKNLLDFKGPVLMYRQQSIVDVPFHQIVPDWDGAISNIFKHINLNQVKHFYILTADSLSILKRAEAFIRQAKLHGVKDEHIELFKIKILPGQSPQLCGSKFGRQFQPADDKFIFVTSDLLAFGALDAFYERGLRPGQFELVSCDNLEARSICPFGEPLLTTIEHPKEEIARRAVDILVDILKKHDDSISIVKIPTKLVIRKSGLTISRENNNKT